MSTRTEEKLTVFRAERRTVWISRKGVGGRQLLGESHVVFHTVFLFELLEVLCDMLTEERQMIVTNRKMQINGRFLSCFRRCNTILRTFYQMLQRGRTRAIAIFME